jgi:hypothetical protein
LKELCGSTKHYRERKRRTMLSIARNALTLGCCVCMYEKRISGMYANSTTLKELCGSTKHYREREREKATRDTILATLAYLLYRERERWYGMDSIPDICIKTYV